MSILSAAAAEDNEPWAVVELGSSAAQGLKGGAYSFGPNLAVEAEPIESWLEIEVGVTPFFGRGGTEWETDFEFKKPFKLRDQLELEIGIGPGWMHTAAGGKSVNLLAAEAQLELALWPGPRHDVGWYLEPSYDYGFGRGHEQSLSVTVGVLIGIP